MHSIIFLLLAGAGLILIGGKSTAVLARGVRNNNPGNLRPNSNFRWNGEIGSDGGYVVFSTMELGVRASYINLRSYFTNGFDTIDKIIARWAPSADNNPEETYAAYVAEKTGFDQTEKLVFNSVTAEKLLSAIFRFELGQNIPAETIKAGIALA